MSVAIKGLTKKSWISTIFLFSLTVVFPTALFVICWLFFIANKDDALELANGPFWISKLPILAVLVYYSILFFWYVRLADLEKLTQSKLSFLMSGLMQGFLVSLLVAVQIGLRPFIFILNQLPNVTLDASGNMLPIMVFGVMYISFIGAPFVISLVFARQLKMLFLIGKTKYSWSSLIILALLFLILGLAIQFAFLALLKFYPTDFISLFTNSCGSWFSQHGCGIR